MPNRYGRVQSRVPPSYAQGYACDSREALYPDLWIGCIGAWAPCLGPTNRTLFDVTGQHNLTLTGFTANTIQNAWKAEPGTSPASTSATIQEGQYALNLNGSTDYAFNVNTRGFTGGTSMSWSAWMKTATAGQVNKYICSLPNASTTNGFDINVNLATVRSLCATTAATSTLTSPSFTYAFTGWHHLATTWDGRVHKLYIDGLLVAQGNLAGTLNVPLNQISIGGFSSGFVQSFGGLIDDVRLYDRGLEERDVIALATRRGISYELKQRSIAAFSKNLNIVSAGAVVAGGSADVYQISSPQVFTDLEIVKPRQKKPSFALGFNRKTSNHYKHPELWQGCVGAWLPSAGPSNYSVQDFSGGNNHAVLTGYTSLPIQDAWVVDDGEYALQFGGSQVAQVIFPKPSASALSFAAATCWFKTDIDQTSNLVQFSSLGFGPNGVNTIRTNISSLVDDKTLTYAGRGWTFAAFTTAGNSNYFWFDNRLITSINLNPLVGISMSFGSSFTGLIDDVRFYERHLTQSDIHKLRSRRGAAYEVPRTRKRLVHHGHIKMGVRCGGTAHVTIAPKVIFKRTPVRPSISYGFARTSDQALHWRLWDGCVAAWSPSIGQTGNQLYDLSNNGLDGSLNAFDMNNWTHEGLSFNGTNNFVNMGSPASLDLKNQVSISTWFRSTGAPAQDAGILGKGSFATTGFHLAHAGTGGANDHKILFHIQATTLATNFVFNDNLWHHVVGTWDGQIMRVYVDGRFQTSGAKTGVMTTATDFELGRRPGAANYFAGGLDDIRIYNRALNEREVTLLSYRKNIAYEFSSWAYPMIPPLRTSQTYDETGSGGVTCGGSSNSNYVYNIAPTGGAVCGGTAAPLCTYNVTGTGGTVCEGTAAFYVLRDHTGTGGVVCGGTATPTAIYNITATGGAVCGGTTSPEIIYLPSGGVVCAGTALSFAIYNITATGGDVCGGTATPLCTYNVTGTGGIVCGGTAAPTVIYNITATGGAVCGGTATSLCTYNVTGTGGIVCGGTAAPTVIYNITPTGGVVCGGTAAPEIIYLPLGGIVCRGTAAPTVIYNITATGGTVVGGTATPLYTYNVTGTSGVVCGGTAAPICTYNVTGTGGVVCGGTAAPICTYNITGTGGAVCGGTAIIDVNAGISGGVVCDGTATSICTYNVTGTGGIVCGGTAAPLCAYNITATGGAVCGGTGPSFCIYTNTGNGGGNCGGAATPLCTYNVTGTGGAVCGGTAAPTVIYNVTGTGGAVCGGDADVTTISGAVGGVTCSGSAICTAIYSITTTGGAVCNGTSAPTVIFIPSGGVVCGGTATPTVTYNVTTTGGAVCGGTAAPTVAYNVTGTGGAVCGGTATTTCVYSITAIGGAVCSGTATFSFNEVGSGGVVCGGTATPTIIYNITATGGAVCGGTATTTCVYNFTGSGGAVCSGTTAFDNNIIASGGAQAGGTAFVVASYMPVGGVKVGGQIPQFYIETVSGGAKISGTSTVALVNVPEVTISGGAVVSGDAYVAVMIQVDAGGSGAGPNLRPGNLGWLFEFLAPIVGSDYTDMVFRYPRNGNPDEDLLVRHPQDQLYLPAKREPRPKSEAQKRYERAAKQSQRLKDYERANGVEFFN